MVQSQDYLAALKRNWRGDGHWLSGTMRNAYGIRALDGVSVPQGQGSMKNDSPHCLDEFVSGNGGIHIVPIVFIDLDRGYGIIIMSKGGNRYADVLIYD